MTHYTMTGGPKGPPFLGLIAAAQHDPMGFSMENAFRYGDIIPFEMIGRNLIQVNHPDLVKYVLMTNHKNYAKSKAYIRFESAIGKGLLTSNGAKWRQDRQTLQPMFRREQLESHIIDVINDVSDKFRLRWLALTGTGHAELNITDEMSRITLEIILKVIFGKDGLDDALIDSLHSSYAEMIGYLKVTRVFPNVDLKSLFRTPASFRFRRALNTVDEAIALLRIRCGNSDHADQVNMLAHCCPAKTRINSIGYLFVKYHICGGCRQVLVSD